MVTVWPDWYPDFGKDVRMRYMTGDGTTVVEVIRLTATGNGRDGE
jgi:hypothetical protein